MLWACWDVCYLFILAQEKIARKFDIDYCKKWMQHIEHMKSEVSKHVGFVLAAFPSGINRIYHYVGEGTRESHLSVHDLQSTMRLVELWMMQIMDTRMGFLLLGHRSQRLQWPIVITRCPSSVCHPSSVRLFTFSTSSPEPLDGFWWNLVWMKYSRSFTSVIVFRPDPSRGRSRAGQK